MSPYMWMIISLSLFMGTLIMLISNHWLIAWLDS